MEISCKYVATCLLLMSMTAHAVASVLAQEESRVTVPYLLPNAPTFDLTLSQFRNQYNSVNPMLMINEYRAINTKDTETSITRAASRINATLYSSVVLEKGTGKIKSIQLTYLFPISRDEKSVDPGHRKHTDKLKDKMLEYQEGMLAIQYMAALMRYFSPMDTVEQSKKKVVRLLNDGRGERYYAQTEGALRYVVSYSDEEGITFAIEPIKLSLSDRLFEVQP